MLELTAFVIDLTNSANNLLHLIENSCSNLNCYLEAAVDAVMSALRYFRLKKHSIRKILDFF